MRGPPGGGCAPRVGGLVGAGALEPDDPDEPLEPDDPDEPLEPDDPDEPFEPDDPDEPLDPGGLGVVVEDDAALAIAAPPPTSAPVTASVLMMGLIRMLIHLLCVDRSGGCSASV
jgi:hypothetical protein